MSISDEHREAAVAELYRHSPTSMACDFGGLVCSNPDHIVDTLLAAGWTPPPQPDATPDPVGETSEKRGTDDHSG